VTGAYEELRTKEKVFSPEKSFPENLMVCQIQAEFPALHKSKEKQNTVA